MIAPAISVAVTVNQTVNSELVALGTMSGTLTWSGDPCRIEFCNRVIARTNTKPSAVLRFAVVAKDCDYLRHFDLRRDRLNGIQQGNGHLRRPGTTRTRNRPLISGQCYAQLYSLRNPGGVSIADVLAEWNNRMGRSVFCSGFFSVGYVSRAR
jgi:hypothetical protein